MDFAVVENIKGVPPHRVSRHVGMDIRNYHARFVVNCAATNKVVALCPFLSPNQLTIITTTTNQKQLQDSKRLVPAEKSPAHMRPRKRI